MRHGLWILAAGTLPSLLLGIVWMRQTGVPAPVYLQNVAAAIVGAAMAAYVSRRRVSAKAGLIVAGVLVLLMLATLLTGGMQGVHRWLLSLHVAAVALPLLLVELDRILRHARLLAFAVMAIVLAILFLQPDAAQATAFAGASALLAFLHKHRLATLPLLALGAASLFRSDPLAPVPYVEEIAVRISQRGVVWQAAVIVALLLLLVPFLSRSTTAGRAVATYLALTIAASYWGTFPVPILGYGMSPILGYFAGWAWLGTTEKCEKCGG